MKNLLDCCRAVVTGTDEYGVYMKSIDEDEQFVCHNYYGDMVRGTSVLVTILSVGRENKYFRRVSIDSVDYDSIPEFEVSAENVASSMATAA